MQQRSPLEHLDVRFRHAQHARNEDGCAGDAHGMPMSERGSGVDRFAESPADIINGSFTRPQWLLSRLQLDHAPVRGGHIGPQSASRGQRIRGANQIRIEPTTASLPGRVKRLRLSSRRV